MNSDPRWGNGAASSGDDASSFDYGPPDWPGSEGSRRTAGGSRTREPGGSEVRDWQRNTWFGPVPPEGNPFDEPEDAPELRESRSENVNDHVGDFWKQETSGYQYSGSVRTAGRDDGKKNVQPSKTGERSGGKAGRIFLILLAFLVVLGLVMRFIVFSIQEIKVTGNVTIPADEIIRLSGIRKGDGILSLDQKTVETRIEGDYRLQFRYLEKTLPQTVTISVREREECCWLTYSGILYTMDKNRMVMFESESLPINISQSEEITYEEAAVLARLSTLVEVRGLNIRSGAQEGQTLMLTTQDQQTAFSELFLEMKVLGCTGMIAQADLSNTLSLMLLTRDGYTVSLGDGSNIHAKLRSMLLVREELQRMGLKGGTISVTNPESPYYSPSAV